jgi:ABC-type dipeptide/oligopeptide/nickel transport system ATPase component
LALPCCRCKYADSSRAHNSLLLLLLLPLCLPAAAGAELESAVESSLRAVNLWNNKVGDKQARQYSGGMKRRLSVAISFTGNPLVVYLDEPSTVRGKPTASLTCFIGEVLCFGVWDGGIQVA